MPPSIMTARRGSPIAHEAREGKEELVLGRPGKISPEREGALKNNISVSLVPEPPTLPVKTIYEAKKITPLIKDAETPLILPEPKGKQQRIRPFHTKAELKLPPRERRVQIQTSPDPLIITSEGGGWRGHVDRFSATHQAYTGTLEAKSKSRPDSKLKPKTSRDSKTVEEQVVGRYRNELFDINVREKRRASSGTVAQRLSAYLKANTISLQGALLFIGEIGHLLWKGLTTSSPGVLMMVPPELLVGNKEASLFDPSLVDLASMGRENQMGIDILRMHAESAYQPSKNADQIPSNIQAVLQVVMLWETHRTPGAKEALEKMNCSRLFVAAKGGDNHALAAIKILSSYGNQRAANLLAEWVDNRNRTQFQVNNFSDYQSKLDEFRSYRGPAKTISFLGTTPEGLYVNKIQTRGVIRGSLGGFWPYEITTRAITKNETNLDPMSAGEVAEFLIRVQKGGRSAEVIVRTKDRDVVAEIHDDLVRFFVKFTSPQEAVDRLIYDSHWIWERSLFQTADDFYQSVLE